MNTTIVQQSEHALTHQSIGQSANEAASKAAFSLYRLEKSANTQKAQKRALNHFARFLSSSGMTITADQLWREPATWASITWGLVEAHKLASLNDGASVASINQRLSTIKTYARLAHQAGFIEDGEALRIRSVRGFHGAKVKRNIKANTQVSKDTKPKKNTNTLASSEVKELASVLADDQTARGKRDRLLFHVLFEHGLRSSEVLLLDRQSFRGACLVFDRPKVGLTDCTHFTRPQTQEAYKAYLDSIGNHGPFWQSTRKNGRLTGRPLGRSALDRAIRRWGELIGIKNLSTHDARHTVATKLAQDGMSATKLLDYFGWSSLGTAQRYVDRAKVGNEGVGAIW